MDLPPVAPPASSRSLTIPIVLFLLIITLLMVVFRTRLVREIPLENKPTTVVPEEVIYPDLSDEPYDVEIDDHPEFGDILIDKEGKTLYFSLADSENVSTCTDACVLQWPPVYTETDTPSAPTGVVNDLGTLTRDGRKQLTYKGSPLYYYKDDLLPGDTLGNEKDDQWFVVPVGEPYK